MHWIREAEWNERTKRVKAVELGIGSYVEFRRCRPTGFDSITDIKSLATGRMGTVWGVEIIASRFNAENVIVFVFEDDSREIRGKCMQKEDHMCGHENCRVVREVMES